MTPLEALDHEVQRRVAEGLPGAVFASELDHHCAHGQRTGCECSYCLVKRYATAHVAGAASRILYPAVANSRDVHSYGSCNPRYTEHWVLIQNVRDAARREARTMLREERDRVT